METHDSVVSYYVAGRTCLRSGRRDQALVMVGEILRHDPLHPLALSLLREMEDRPAKYTGPERRRAVRSGAARG